MVYSSGIQWSGPGLSEAADSEVAMQHAEVQICSTAPGSYALRWQPISANEGYSGYIQQQGLSGLLSLEVPEL